MKNFLLSVLATACIAGGLFIKSSSAEPLRLVDTASYDEAYCLAQNIYFEARNQSRLGQIAVSLVVLERVKQDFYPDTICGVVQQGSLRTGRIYGYNEAGERVPVCQFSWYCDGRSDEMANEEHIINAFRVAWYVLHNPQIWGLLDGADHYHADYVNPAWAGTAVAHRITQIDDHIFWRR